MTFVKCPQCEVVVTIKEAGLVFDASTECPELRGTKFLDPDATPNPGPQWCPVLSDALPGGLSLFPIELRPDVDEAIAKARRAGK